MAGLKCRSALVMLVGTALLAGGCATTASKARLPMPPKEKDRFRVALIGCHQQFDPAPALEQYVKLDPDVCIWVGDNVYADTEDDPSYLEKCYAALAAQPGFDKLRQSSKFAVTWDDHDFGSNNDGKNYALKEESKDIFRRFWGLESVVPANRPGVWHAQTFRDGDHTLRVILLDIRYNRDDPGPEGDMLGAEQWAWLEGELAKPADLTLVVSGTQVLVEVESGWETWQFFPKSYARLVDTIRRSGSERVVFITGDQHYGEVLRQRGVLDHDAIEIMFAGINQTERPGFTQWRVTPAALSNDSVGYLDIQWDATAEEVPHLTFKALDALNGQTEITYRVNMNEIELPLEIGGMKEFVDQGRCTIASGHAHLEARYTLDGSKPTAASPLATGPIAITQTSTVRAACFDPAGFRRGRVHSATYTKVAPTPAVAIVGATAPGLAYRYFEGDFADQLPEFKSLKAVSTGIATELDVTRLAQRADGFGMVFEGYLDVPVDGMYALSTTSDDGSRLYLHDKLVVDNDGSHSSRTRTGGMALAAGLHPLRLEYFDEGGSQQLTLTWQVPGTDRDVAISSTHLVHKATP